MDWVEALQDINYLAVVVGVVSAFVVGMAWYSMSMFGKTWMKEVGLSKKDVEKRDDMAKAMGHTAVSTFIAVAVVAALMLATGTDGAVDGAVFGAVIGFGIAMTSMVPHDVFSKRSMKLTKINGLHDVVKYAVIGAIIGGFGF